MPVIDDGTWRRPRSPEIPAYIDRWMMGDRRTHQGYRKRGTHMAPELGRGVAHVKLDISR